jgi:hypothetical protein
MKQRATLYRCFGAALAVQIGLLASTPPALAQQSGTPPSVAVQQAAQLALQASRQWAGVAMPAASFRVASARTEPTGLLYAYLQQLQAGIPVYNRMATLVFKGSELCHHAGGFLPAKTFAGQPATPTVTAAAALATALASTGLQNLEVPRVISPASGTEQQQTFEPAGMASRPIEVRLVWATDKGQPRLAWNVNVDLLASPDWLNIRVDAATGQVLGQDNWTVNERAAHPAMLPGRRALGSTSPARQPQAQPLRQPGSAKSALAVASASYRVVPFANERPDVTTPRVDTDPWLRAGTGNPAATYGWHSDGTTDYPYTRGNNVWAYKDSTNTDTPTLAFSTLSTGTNGMLVFNDIPDFTQKVSTLGKIAGPPSRTCFTGTT